MQTILILLVHDERDNPPVDQITAVTLRRILACDIRIAAQNALTGCRLFTRRTVARFDGKDKTAKPCCLHEAGITQIIGEAPLCRHLIRSCIEPMLPCLFVFLHDFGTPDILRHFARERELRQSQRIRPIR